MKKIQAKSKFEFAISEEGIPSQKKQFKGVINKDNAHMREWAGKNHKDLPGSPLKKGSRVTVCDAILSDSGTIWYYVLYKEQYGFVCSKWIDAPLTNADIFVNLLTTYSDYVKKNHRYFGYKYDPALTTFAKAKAKVKRKRKATITCAVPPRWALHDMGITRFDGSSLVWVKDGSFKHCYSGEVKKKLKRITSGGPIGKTHKQAIKDGSLKKGDIVAFTDATHTTVWSGEGHIFFDAGRVIFKYGISKSGFRVNYDKAKPGEKRKIKEVLRWRN